MQNTTHLSKDSLNKVCEACVKDLQRRVRLIVLDETLHFQVIGGGNMKFVDAPLLQTIIKQ